MTRVSLLVVACMLGQAVLAMPTRQAGLAKELEALLTGMMQ